MRLIDTHCHIHESEFFDSHTQREVYQRALDSGVGMICVSTSEEASREAVQFVLDNDNSWAVIGVHPHEADKGYQQIGKILAEKHPKVIGVGEIGLDYFYMNSPRERQIEAFEQQLQWAVDYNLPVSFHVRDTNGGEKLSVWSDFWPIFNNFSNIRGVLHSFTDSKTTLEKALGNDLFIGVNGIATFATDRQDIYASIPLGRVLLETDAPFLTPKPFRGTMNEPKYVERVAEHLATLHKVSLEEVANITTQAAKQLFAI